MVIDFESLTAVQEEEQSTEAIPTPRIKVEEADDRYGKFTAEPLEPGFGITLGNALRRVLYSSLPGTAITAVKIEGADPEDPSNTKLVLHEYSTIPFVRESVTEFLLNVKSIRLKANVNRQGRLRLEVAGEGEVCAGDIMASADFEVVNPELHLATLDSPQAKLSVEFTVERGKGYAPAPEASADRPIGVLPVDAIFAPVRKVNYQVETARVGGRSDMERLILEVWTDGTMNPVDAIKESANTLVSLFFLFANVQPGDEEGAEPPLALRIPPEKYNVPVERLQLSSRTLNCLRRANLEKVGQVLEMKRSELLQIRNFGEKSLQELYERLRDNDLLIPDMDWGFEETEEEEEEEKAEAPAAEAPEEPAQEDEE